MVRVSRGRGGEPGGAVGRSDIAQLAGWHIDIPANLVQFGAKGCPVAEAQKKRFTVSLDAGDYDAMRSIADSHRPPLKLQYVVNVAVKNLLERHAARQLAFPLDD